SVLPTYQQTKRRNNVCNICIRIILGPLTFENDILFVHGLQINCEEAFESLSFMLGPNTRLNLGITMFKWYFAIYAWHSASLT
ncbi:hypothetical protein AAULR_26071, partial [Lacticaseibacillus rhamnosus MTCC 5462]